MKKITTCIIRSSQWNYIIAKENKNKNIPVVFLEIADEVARTRDPRVSFLYLPNYLMV